MSRSNSVKPHVIDLLSDGKARTYTDILLALGDKFPEMASDPDPEEQTETFFEAILRYTQMRSSLHPELM